MRERFLHRVLLGCAPLMVWAGHFAALYLLAALHASLWLLVALSVLATGACVVLCLRSMHALRQAGSPLDAWAMAANAIIALIGVGWSTLPLLILGVAGQA